MKHTLSLLFTVLLTASLLLTAGCRSSLSKEEQDAKQSASDAAYPQDPKDVRRDKHGKIMGEDGIVLFGGSSKKGKAGDGTGIGVNSYLWRATLDTISFMPLTSADPFGGVIITDWYEDPKAQGERLKLNIAILSDTLRADAVRVSVFRQKNKGGAWRDAEVNPQTATELENKILTRARELRILGN